MSGTGKSSALAELRARGYETVDTDEGHWSEWSDDDGGYLWREDLITGLLERERDGPLFVSGTVSNQGRFYPCFDAIVLFSAPTDVILERLEVRTTNGYGKSKEQRALILEHIAEVEPRLRATCTHELDGSRPLAELVDDLERIAHTSS